jgi:chromosome segregation ATPase
MPFRRRAKEFEALSDQVAGLTARLEQAQHQREVLEARLAQLDQRTADLGARATELAARTGDLHQRTGDVQARATELAARTEALGSRTDELSAGHQAMRARLDEVAVTVRNQLGELGGELDALDAHVRAVTVRLPDGELATAADVEGVRSGQVALANELVRHEIALRQDLAVVAERAGARR